MAKVNNSEVIQKLIDELQLYPGKDLIPSEIADKILPTFQINDQAVTMSTEPSTIVRYGNQTGVGANTLYTTPSTGSFYVTSVSINTNGSNAGTKGWVSVTINGTNYRLIELMAQAADNPNNSISFPNPVLVDAGSVIDINHNQAGTTSSATITGYHIAD